MKNIHIKTAFSNIRRSPYQALSAIFVLTITFFMATILAILVYSSDKILEFFETRPQIIAFIKDTAKEEEVSSLKLKLISDPRVKEVRYVSKEEALQIYKEATVDNPLLSELVSPSIFPASLELSVKDLKFAQEVIDEVKQSPFVEQLGFTASLGGESTLTDTVSRLKTITWYIRLGGIALVSVLTGVSFVVLLVIITMRLTTRKYEVEILELIGATPGFIRKPIIIEALVYTITGVLLGWILALILILYSTPSLAAYFREIVVLPRETLELFLLFGVIFTAEVIVGITLAFLGSVIALSRAHKIR